MANTLEYAKLFQTSLDAQVVQEATTGWMEANAGTVKYNGGNEIKIPTLALDGLANYDRANGHTKGSIDYKYQTFNMTQDRGRSFSIDAMDVDETGFVTTAGTILGEFQRTQVIPEIDAYRYSKIAALAVEGNRSREVALTAEKALNELLADLAGLQDAGVTGSVIVTLSPVTAQLLSQDPRFTNLASEAVLKQGSLDLQLTAVNGNTLVKSPSARLKTAYVFNDGKTAGQEAGGFKPATDAKDINWIIAAQDAPVAISKTDTPRIFDPMTNQEANAWKVDYRKYHDLFITENKLAKVFVNLKA